MIALEVTARDVAASIAREPADVKAAPILKWAGGKRQLLPEITKHVPMKFNRYFEPFFGGGALFFHLEAEGFMPFARAQINDANESLMRCYRAVRDDVDGVIRNLRPLKYDEKFYYAVRAKFPSGTDVQRAAQLIYLNRTCFNGLYRVNRTGQFNVPFGRYTNPTICDVDGLRAASRALKTADLGSVDFGLAVGAARKGDFGYFDPPYWPASGSADFTSYTKSAFGPAEQERLRDIALVLKRRGVTVLLSNADVPPIRKLYAKGFELRKVLARRNINSAKAKRGNVGELLIW